MLVEEGTVWGHYGDTKNERHSLSWSSKELLQNIS